MKLGILTGGGDAPGLNAVIRAIVMKANGLGHDVIGFYNGWAGVVNNEVSELSPDKVEDIEILGGTILFSSRYNIFKHNTQEKAVESLKKNKVDCLIAIGGDDTLGAANKLSKLGINVIGVPKTIDNDLSCTDVTFGFDTAINRASEAIEKLHTTAKSHHRVMVVEVMGREAGWIALQAGLAGGAHVILIPEVPFDLDDICKKIQDRHNKGKTYTIVVVSEGAIPKEGTNYCLSQEKDSFGHVRLGGIGPCLEKDIEKKTGIETRSVVLGHLQRSGSPTAFDRVLGTRFGVKAVELAHNKEFGSMAALQGNEIKSCALDDAVSKQKLVDAASYEMAKSFFW